MTVNTLPTVAAITGPSYVGTGKDISLQDATTGGTWSVNNSALATISSNTANPVTVHGVAAGAPVVTYTVTGGNSCTNSAIFTISVYNTLLAHYYTNQNGNYSNSAIWNIDRKDGKGEVLAGEVPTNDDNVTVRDNVALDQNYAGTTNATFEITGGSFTIQPNKSFSSAGSVDFGGIQVTVQSNATGTGAIGAITNSNGSIANATKVTVERFIGSSEYPSGRRAWQLLTSPVTGTTINASWQEGLVSNTGSPIVGDPKYGTLITGRVQRTAGNAFSHGYDFWSAIAQSNASILRYRGAATTGVWDTLPGTGLNGLNIESYPAYLLFVRGNRAALNTDTGLTTLRATGTLKQGKQNITLYGSSNQSYTLIGNPYASPIDFDKIYTNNGTTVILPRFTIWNGNLGTYGAYELVVKSGTGYTIVPYPFNSNTPSVNNNARYIPSSAGFFVQPAGTSDGNLAIDESAKAPAQTALINPFREKGTIDKLFVNLNLKNNDTSAIITDGVLARFGDNYSADVDVDDVKKQANLYENLGIRSKSTDLIVEARPTILQTDTLQLKLWNVSKRSYQIQVKAEDFDTLSMMHAWLEDSYLKTKQAIDLNGAITTVDFAVTSDSASFKSNRFRIVFMNTAVVLPVVLRDVKATATNGGVNVNWTVENEVNMQRYTVERSIDGGKSYTQIATLAAKNQTSAGVTSYNSFDALPKTGDNLYRIKMESKDGTISYSNIVLVTLGADTKDVQITMYPNPVEDGKLHLQLSNLTPGIYSVSIYSVNGQLVYQKKITISQANSIQQELLLLGNKLAQGSYQIQIADANGVVVKKAAVVIAR